MKQIPKGLMLMKNIILIIDAQTVKRRQIKCQYQKNERIRRNFIKSTIANFQLDINNIRRIVDEKGITIENVLIDEIKARNTQKLSLER